MYVTIFTPRHTGVKTQAGRRAGILRVWPGRCSHRKIDFARMKIDFARMGRRASSRSGS
jgi:hypothetical protein